MDTGEHAGKGDTCTQNMHTYLLIYTYFSRLLLISFLKYLKLLYHPVGNNSSNYGLFVCVRLMHMSVQLQCAHTELECRSANLLKRLSLFFKGS